MRALAATTARALRFARPENWFFSSSRRLLAVAYLGILGREGDGAGALRLLACYLFLDRMRRDLRPYRQRRFDVEADRRAGKANSMAAVSPARRLLLATTFVLAGFLRLSSRTTPFP
jgi:hypothetical protein